MAKKITAYKDSHGNIHRSSASAFRADRMYNAEKLKDKLDIALHQGISLQEDNSPIVPAGSFRTVLETLINDAIGDENILNILRAISEYKPDITED